MLAADHDRRLDEIIAAYLAAEKSGQPPDLSGWISRYPDLAAELSDFFADRQHIERLAKPIRSAIITIHAEHSSPNLKSEITNLKSFGSYDLLSELGRGGMGIVYCARHRGLNRMVALKMIRAGQLASSADVERFQAEAEAAAQLDHPHIVPIYEVGQHEGHHYFTMKHIAGGSLADTLRREGEPPAELNRKLKVQNPKSAAELLSTIARAVHYAHQRGILHRDLKPANVLLDSEGRPYVTDFGLAKILAADHTDTQSGLIIGTANYMAPEQAAGSKSLTTAADIYSLGAILYELLTGSVPFRAPTPLESILLARDHDPKPPRALNAAIDRDLETICLKCLEKDASRRYSSAAALADDLDCWAAGEPIATRPTTALERTLRRCRKNPLVTILAASIPLVALFGLIGILNQWQAALTSEQRANAQRDEAQRQRDAVRNLNDRLERTLYTADINLAKHAWDLGSGERTLELLDRHRPQSGQTDLRGFEWHYLRRLCHSDLLTINVPAAGVDCVAFSPNGQRLAGGLSSGTVMVWDTSTGQELLTLKEHQQPARSIAFSSDGTLLASGSGRYGARRKEEVPGEVKVWDAQTGKELLSLKEAGQVFCVAFSPDGRRLASAADDGTRLWDSQSGELLLSIPEAAEPNGSGCVAFCPDGRRLVTSGGGRSLHDGARLKIWDAESGQQLLDLKGHTGNVYSAAISPDGRRLASASFDHTAKIWDLKTGQELLTLNGHSLSVQAIAFSPDGHRVASGSLDGVIRLWDVQNGQEIFTIKGRSGYIYSLAFSPDGKRLASTRGGDIPPVATVVIPEGKPAASAKSSGITGYVNVWDAEQRQECFTFHEQPSTDRGLAFSPSGQRLLTAGASTARLWDIQSRQEVLAFNPADSETGFYLYTGGFSPDGKRIATGGARGTLSGKPTGAVLKIWDAKSGSEVHSLEGHTDFIWDLAFSPNSRRLATASNDQTVRIWDVTTGRETLTFRGHDQPVWSVAYRPDGKCLASAGPKANIKMWDAESGEELPTFHSTASAAYAVAFSPDGKRLAGASLDWTVRVSNAETGMEQLALKGHVARVIKIVFSPDGKRLASASTDRTVKVWDLASGEELLTLSGHPDYMLNLAFSPDGHRLASVSADGAVKIWDATPAAERQAE